MKIEKRYSKGGGISIGRFLILPLCMILSLALVLNGCSSQAKEEPQTPYAKNKAETMYDHSTPVYDLLVREAGQEKADALLLGIGNTELDLLAYGIGTSNMILMVNLIHDMNKLITMVGSDFPAGSETGLGATRIVNLLDTVDYWLQQNKYTGSLPGDQDTITRLATFINNLSAVDIDAKVTGLINAMGVTRDMSDKFGATHPNDQDKLDRMAKLIAHVDDLNKVIDVMSDMDAAMVTTRMKDLLLNVTDGEHLVEVMDGVTQTAKMVTVLETVADASRLATVINNMTTGRRSKLGYTLDNVTDPATLVYMIDNIGNPIKMASLLDEMEDGTTWTDQVNGAQTWTGVPSGANSGMVRLVAIINGLATSPDPAKLIYIMNQVTDMTKMMRIIQDVVTAADMVTLIHSMADPGVNPVPVNNMGYVIENVDLPTIPRMRMLVDGERIFGNTGDQAIYLGKLNTLIASLDNAQEGPAKVADLIKGVTNVDKIIDLTYDVTVVSNLALIINGVNKSTSTWPNNTAVRTLIYMVENAMDSSKLVTVINQVNASNVKDLINNVAAGSQWSDAQPVHTQPNVDDPDAAGKKLNNVIDGASDVTDLVFLLNNVSNFNKMADLINALRIASTPKVATLVNNITGANAWNAGTPSAATGVGKLVNMVDNITNLSDMAVLIDNINDATKLSDLVNQIANSSLVVSLVNAVIADPLATSADLVGMMNGVNLADIPKLSTLVTGLNGAKDALVAGLLAPYAADASQGVGYATMSTMMIQLADVTAAGNLATLMLNLNVNLNYRGGTVSAKVGMTRLLRAGVLYLGVQFPGLGPVHVAVMMNGADDPMDLAALINSVPLEQMVPMVGCGDHVGDPDNNGLPPFDPDFHTPCVSCAMGW